MTLVGHSSPAQYIFVFRHYDQPSPEASTSVSDGPRCAPRFVCALSLLSVKVSVSKKYQTVAGLTQNYLFFPEKYKDCYLVYLLNGQFQHASPSHASTQSLPANPQLSSLAHASTPSVWLICSAILGPLLCFRILEMLTCRFGAIPIHGKLSQVPLSLHMLHITHFNLDSAQTPGCSH